MELGILTHGPRSDGVTGSDGGGGRLMRVGADILSLRSKNSFGDGGVFVEIIVEG